MDVIKAINKRYSVRAYKTDPVEEEKLTTILNAACMAPTANNRQPVKIIVVHTAGKEEQLLTVYSKPWFVQAPLVLCVCGIPSEAWVRRDGRQYLYVDAAIVMDHIVLAACNLGLGTCFIAAFDEMNARKALAIPDEAEPILITPVGYPADKPKPKIRKDITDLVCYEHW